MQARLTICTGKFFAVENWPVHLKMFSSSSGLYLLEASSTFPQVITIKSILKYYLKSPEGQNCLKWGNREKGSGGWLGRVEKERPVRET